MMRNSEQIEKIAAALAKAQGEMTNPPMDSVNPFFKSRYASLPGIRDHITPTLASNGIAVIQSLKVDGDRLICTTILTHSSGQWISSDMIGKAIKDDPQGWGSATTYARRYGLMAALNIVGDEDDDGASASVPQNKPASKPPVKSNLPDEDFSVPDDADPFVQSKIDDKTVRKLTARVKAACKKYDLDPIHVRNDLYKRFSVSRFSDLLESQVAALEDAIKKLGGNE